MACSSRAPQAEVVPLEAWTLPAPKTRADGEIIVATVDGVPITAGEIARRAKAGGLTVEQALEQAVDDQLILAHAQANPQQDLSDAYKAAAAMHLIANQFEPANTPQSIPDSTLREIYDEIQKRDYPEPEFADKKFIFVHGEWRATFQLVVQAQELTDAETASTVESLLRLTRDHYLLHPEPGEETFRESAWNLFRSYVPVRFERLPPLAKEDWDNLYRLNGDFDKNYLDRVFALPAVGASSDVFPTQHGLHWVFLAAIIPSRNSSFDEVREELRSSIGDSHRAQEFEKWLHRLRSEHQVFAPGGRK